MFCSCLKWCSGLLIFLLLSCGNSLTDGSVVVGSAEDGFSVRMPHEPDRQSTSLDIHGHIVDLRVHLIGDSGVMFGVTFFIVPQAIMERSEGERIDLLWEFFSQRSDGILQGGPGPLGENASAIRNGWLQQDGGSRMGVAVLLNHDKAAVVYTATPVQFHTAASERKMVDYFKSLEIHLDPVERETGH